MQVADARRRGVAAAAFICLLDESSGGPPVAVKDNIDVAGTVTTAGSRALADRAVTAERDAPCLSGIRAADACIVGKTNLDELAMSAHGINPWFGTPINPIDTELIPGGSSSGSAVAVADGLVDVAIGTDTSGSVRIPAACCGVYGLKTTHGRIPTDGVVPLAPSLDTVGPLARDVAGLELGMALLEPGFTMADTPARRIGRLPTHGDARIEAAVDAALERAGVEVVPVDVALDEGDAASTVTFFCEVLPLFQALAASCPHSVSSHIHRILDSARRFAGRDDVAAELCAHWRGQLTKVFEDVELVALPTLPIPTPTRAAVRADHRLGNEVLRFTGAFNAAGTPASAQPVPVPDTAAPASLQLVAPWGREDLLARTVAEIEAANLAASEK